MATKKTKSLAERLAEGKKNQSAEKSAEIQRAIEERDRKLAEEAAICAPNSKQQYKELSLQQQDAILADKMKEQGLVEKLAKEAFEVVEKENAEAKAVHLAKLARKEKLQV